MEKYFHISSSLGYHHNPWSKCVRLLHCSKPIANLHEVHPSFQYQRGMVLVTVRGSSQASCAPPRLKHGRISGGAVHPQKHWTDKNF